MEYVEVRQLNNFDELRKEEYDWLVPEYSLGEVVGLWYPLGDEYVEIEKPDVVKTIVLAVIVHGRLFPTKVPGVVKDGKCYVDHEALL